MWETEVKLIFNVENNLLIYLLIKDYKKAVQQLSFPSNIQ